MEVNAGGLIHFANRSVIIRFSASTRSACENVLPQALQRSRLVSIEIPSHLPCIGKSLDTRSRVPHELRRSDWQRGQDEVMPTDPAVTTTPGAMPRNGSILGAARSLHAISLTSAADPKSSAAAP